MITPFMNPGRVPLHAQIHSHYSRRDDCRGAAQALAEDSSGIQSAVRGGADDLTIDDLRMHHRTAIMGQNEVLDGDMTGFRIDVDLNGGEFDDHDGLMSQGMEALGLVDGGMEQVD